MFNTAPRTTSVYKRGWDTSLLAHFDRQHVSATIHYLEALRRDALDRGILIQQSAPRHSRRLRPPAARAAVAYLGVQHRWLDDFTDRAVGGCKPCCVALAI